jgi:galactokinase
MLDAWRRGDAREVGRIFREDGFGLRDDYQISGLELESMCEIARGVEGVLGERMLGGGDKGASGALVLESAAEELLSAVQREYPQRHPEYADKFAVHFCRAVAGVVELPGLSLA